MAESKVQQKPTGFECPSCKGFIPVAMHQLLSSGEIQCPNCSLTLRVNRQQSKKAVAALEKVNEAERRLEKASVFKG
ncbi:MAG: hypothetical protein LUF87_01775 [Alistipes sp.]|nr:hypothetical protein [Alistipes sp.]